MASPNKKNPISDERLKIIAAKYGAENVDLELLRAVADKAHRRGYRKGMFKAYKSGVDIAVKEMMKHKKVAPVLILKAIRAAKPKK